MADFRLPNDSDADTEVSGYFQLSDLAQFATVRTLLPELQSQPIVQLIQRLHSDGLRWHVESLSKWRARLLQREAEKHGFQFIVQA